MEKNQKKFKRKHLLSVSMQKKHSNKNKPILLHGDCLKLMFDLPGNSVDMVCCDMPYGTTACKWDTILPLDMLWNHYKRIVKDNGAIVLFASQPFTSILVMSNLKLFKYQWVWEKNKVTGFLNAKRQPMRKHEDICVFYRKQPHYNPIKTKGHKPVNSYTKHTSDGETVGKTKKGIKGGGSTERYPHTILNFPVVNQDGTNDGGNFHPTQKPVSLIEYLIKTYTNEGNTVLDNCAGSFTTGVACINLNRKFIGIESEKNHYNIGVKRVKGALEQLNYGSIELDKEYY